MAPALSPFCWVPMAIQYEASSACGCVRVLAAHVLVGLDGVVPLLGVLVDAGQSAEGDDADFRGGFFAR